MNQAVKKIMSQKNLSPLLKWPGGKTGELGIILQNMPEDYERYFEPFLGGGAVYWAQKNRQCFVNDISDDLINFYSVIKQQDSQFIRLCESVSDFWLTLEQQFDLMALQLASAYHANDSRQMGDMLTLICRLVSEQIPTALNRFDPEWLEQRIYLEIPKKTQRMRKLEAQHGQISNRDIRDNYTAVTKACIYYLIRHLYNNEHEYSIGRSERAFLFFFLREYAYASMFRFNKNGEFNVPYGGISYNRKTLLSKLAKMLDDRVKQKMQQTRFNCGDFSGFIAEHQPSVRDFIFLDPPYDTEFSEYDKTDFTRQDQSRLAEYLTAECEARFMLVIKSTPFIRSLYENKPGVNLQGFDKKYLWNIKDRNDRETVHLMITNY